jgi:alanine dehydrogenase
MIIGVLKEIKEEEYRVATTPGGVEVMRSHGHQVLLECNAGARSGFNDDLYAQAGAEIICSTKQIVERAQMILRVKASRPSEFELLRKDQIYFSYMHLAASSNLTSALIKSGAIGIAYETVQKADGSLPLLTPMSEVAGPMAIQEGAKYLEMAQGGQGVLLGGVPGTDPGCVVIIGGGVVGIHAAKIACGLGAKVYLLETNLKRLRYLSETMPANCFILMSTPSVIRDLVIKADIVVGAVLIPGSKTPKLVTSEMVKMMKPGSVLVDVAIDQGGCFETSKETTHANPIYTINEVVHYAVTNMPGALPKTATLALTNATLPYVLEIADKGYQRAASENPEIGRGLNIVKGRVTCKGVAEAFNLEYVQLESLLQGAQ